MAEVFDQTPHVIAKELTLAIMEKNAVYTPNEPTPENSGDQYGKLFKRILKNVREAIKGEYE